MKPVREPGQSTRPTPPPPPEQAAAAPGVGAPPRPSGGRAHTGFCHSNVHRCTTMAASDGSLFEHCFCGCPPPNGVTVNVMHALLNDCITESLSVGECAARVANQPRGAVSAVRAAMFALVAQGIVDQLPEGW